MAMTTKQPLIGYHAFDARHLDCILEEGLHLTKSRAWDKGILASGEGVYLASTPQHACRLGEHGGLAVCRVGRGSAMADEDEVPALLHESVLRAGPAFGIVPYVDYDAFDKAVKTFCGFEHAAAMRAHGIALDGAIAEEFGKLCAKRSSVKADPDLCLRMVRGWNSFNSLMRRYGGTLGSSMYDIPPGTPELLALKALEHEVCARHADLGFHRKVFSFRSTVALGYDGDDAVLAVLTRGMDGWTLERGELPDEALTALERIAPVEVPSPGLAP